MLTDLLDPKPFRGDALAAGVVTLVPAAALLALQSGDAIPRGVRLGLLVLLWFWVTLLAWRAPIESPRPRRYQSVLFVCSLLLALLALAMLARLTGSGAGLHDPGALAWALGVCGLQAAVLARARNSGVCTLVAAVCLAAALAGLVVHLHGPGAGGTLRWLLAAIAVAYTINAVRLRDRRRRHAVAFTEAGGLALAGLAMTWTGRVLPIPGISDLSPFHLLTAQGRPGWAWSGLLLVAGFGLIAYGGADHERGPVWIGALLLLQFVTLEAAGGLLGWPLVLLVAGVLLLIAALRPTIPAPPEPGSERVPEPPLRFPRP